MTIAVQVILEVNKEISAFDIKGKIKLLKVMTGFEETVTFSLFD